MKLVQSLLLVICIGLGMDLHAFPLLSWLKHNSPATVSADAVSNIAQAVPNEAVKAVPTPSSIYFLAKEQTKEYIGAQRDAVVGFLKTQWDNGINWMQNYKFTIHPYGIYQWCRNNPMIAIAVTGTMAIAATVGYMKYKWMTQELNNYRTQQQYQAQQQRQAQNININVPKSDSKDQAQKPNSQAQT